MFGQVAWNVSSKQLVAVATALTLLTASMGAHDNYLVGNHSSSTLSSWSLKFIAHKPENYEFSTWQHLKTPPCLGPFPLLAIKRRVWGPYDSAVVSTWDTDLRLCESSLNCHRCPQHSQCTTWLCLYFGAIYPSRLRLTNAPKATQHL